MSLTWQPKTERPRQALLQMPISEERALELAIELGDRLAAQAGREHWSAAEYDAAQAEFERLLTKRKGETNDAQTEAGRPGDSPESGGSSKG